MGDRHYGDGDTRQALRRCGSSTLIARQEPVPGRPNRTHFRQEDFRIGLEAGSVLPAEAGYPDDPALGGMARTGQTGHALTG